MFNKDKRSLVLLLALADGCLHYTSNKVSGSITIDHGIAQADYQKWKAELLSYVFDREVKVRTGHNGGSVQVSVSAKRLKAWRKFCYPNNKKSIPKILKFMRHPELALAVMFGDDGYVEPSLSDNKQNIYGASLRLFFCDQSEQELKFIQEWFNTNFNVETKVKFMKNNKKKKTYPYLAWTQKDSLVLWKIVRDFLLKFKSMQHKFRYIEHIYQVRILQRTPSIS